jgi:hypothetical protein
LSRIKKIEWKDRYPELGLHKKEFGGKYGANEFVGKTTTFKIILIFSTIFYACIVGLRIANEIKSLARVHL